jgi:hypothetical protein
MLRSIRQECEKKPSGKGAVLNQNDIARMKQSTKIETADDKKQAAMKAQEERDIAMAKSNARKAKIQALDKERAAKIQPNDIEIGQRQKDMGILSKAQA